METHEEISAGSGSDEYDEYSDDSVIDYDNLKDTYSEDEEGTIRVNVYKKTFQELNELRVCQELRRHKKTIWTMKFSPDGKYLATAGEDGVIYVWKVRSVTRKEWKEKMDMRVFEDDPVHEYVGHTSHIVDLAWSKSGFLISASLDCSVRLWHLNDPGCLCVFKHKDMVTSVDFYPEEECYFISGCMDRKLRIWSIPQGCVLKWVQAPSIITTVTFCPGGRLCAAGLYDGQVIFYYSDGLRYFTQTECRNRRGKDKKGRKVTGISFLKRNGSQCMVVTTNDSRIRLMSMDTFGLISKYKGHANRSRQFRATLSSDKKYIVCGSDDDRIFMWRTACDLTGKPLEEEEIIHYDSYECFRCCLENESLSCASIIPDSVIHSYRPEVIDNTNEVIQAYKKKNNIKDDLNSCFVFIAGTTEGNIHVFSSFSMPKKLS